MRKSDVSVILPVYNGGEYLSAAIQSILNQSFGNFELIIVNDGSLDHTEEVISSFSDDRIVYVKNVENIGIVKSLNKALSIASSKYIARMDADDISYPQRLKVQYEYLELHSEIGVCGSFVNVKETGECIKYPETHENIVFELLIQNVIAHPVVMIRKELLDNYKLQYDDKFYPAEDYKLWIDLITKTKFYNIQFPLLEYNQHSLSISQSNQDIQLKKIYEIRTIYLLNSLRLNIKDAFVSMQRIISFENSKDLQHLEKSKTVLSDLASSNKNVLFFDQKKLLKLLSLYWYVEVHGVDIGIKEKIKIYLSLRHLGLCNFLFFIKLILNAI
ncbi:glycosyltransferase family 2 protein [uncultured Cytophaga sp.]|uniref:glycosyltransferase family 2 protein n=1 Tax=uncultured Cytophaga sp. TaxID=160238 RepID=UPI00260E8CD9|nr:glycosyltransferase family 2 protein [uncultured Cytophaga sp.]